MSDIKIRPATSDADVAAVVALCWAYRDYLIGMSPKDAELTEAFYPEPKYRQLMADLAVVHGRPKGIILIAEDAAGAIAGCGMTHALDDQTSEIKRVYITDAARGKGAARTLCTALIEQARADGFTRVVLDTSKSLTIAQELYLKLGFQPRGPYQPIPEAVISHILFFELPL